jgi:hypothetical protein
MSATGGSREQSSFYKINNININTQCDFSVQPILDLLQAQTKTYILWHQSSRLGPSGNSVLSTTTQKRTLSFLHLVLIFSIPITFRSSRECSCIVKWATTEFSSLVVITFKTMAVCSDVESVFSHSLSPTIYTPSFCKRHPT